MIIITNYYTYKAPGVYMNLDLILKILNFIFNVIKFVKKLCDEEKAKKKNNRK